MEVSNYLVSWFLTYLGDLQPTYTEVIIHFTKYHGHPSIEFELKDDAYRPWIPGAPANNEKI